MRTNSSPPCEERPKKRQRIYSSSSDSDENHGPSTPVPARDSRNFQLVSLFGDVLSSDSAEDAVADSHDGENSNNSKKVDKSGKTPLVAKTQSDSKAKKPTSRVKESKSKKEAKPSEKDKKKPSDQGKKRKDEAKQKEEEKKKKESKNKDAKSTTKSKQEKAKEETTSEKSKADVLKFRIPKRPPVPTGVSAGLPPLVQENLDQVLSKKTTKTPSPEVPVQSSDSSLPAPYTAPAVRDHLELNSVSQRPLRDAPQPAGSSAHSILNIVPTTKDQMKSVGFADNLTSVHNISPHTSASEVDRRLAPLGPEPQSLQRSIFSSPSQHDFFPGSVPHFPIPPMARFPHHVFGNPFGQQIRCPPPMPNLMNHAPAFFPNGYQQQFDHRPVAEQQMPFPGDDQRHWGMNQAARFCNRNAYSISSQSPSSTLTLPIIINDLKYVPRASIRPPPSGHRPLYVHFLFIYFFLL